MAKANRRSEETRTDTKGTTATGASQAAVEAAAKAGAKAAEDVMGPVSARLNGMNETLQLVTAQQQQLIAKSRASGSSLVPRRHTQPPATTSVPGTGWPMSASHQQQDFTQAQQMAVTPC